jgi:small conductance mechanosensitive channel
MDFARAYQTLLNIGNDIIAALPNLFLAFLIVTAFYLIAKRIRLIVTYTTDRRQKAKHLGQILGRLAQSAVVTIGVLVALTMIFPSFRPSDLIQLLGIGSVAIGFAFHDIFQNFLAGILLLLTAPFKLGDQISVESFEGTVEDIQTRATTIKTHDGRRIVIPNTDLFTHSVTVNTAFGWRCLEHELVVSFYEDIDRVKTLIVEALASVDGVATDPPPEALVVSLAESGVTIRVHWWTRTPQHRNLLHLQDKVLTTLRRALIKGEVVFPVTSQQIQLKGHLDGREQGDDFRALAN